MKHRALVFLMMLLLCMTIVSCRSQSDTDSEESSGEKQTETASGSTSSAAEDPQDPSEAESNGNEISEEPSSPSQDGEQAEATEAGSDNTIPPESDLADPEFSFQFANVSLTLRESGIEEKIAELPFEFISDTVEELGEGSDTFAGSFLKTVKYEGLELSLFAPKDNPEYFWIMQMTASAPGIYTYRGIQVGDTKGTMLDIYPEAALIPGTEIFRYAIGDFEELTFTLSENEIISHISLTYYMP